MLLVQHCPHGVLSPYTTHKNISGMHSARDPTTKAITNCDIPPQSVGSAGTCVQRRATPSGTRVYLLGITCSVLAGSFCLLVSAGIPQAREFIPRHTSLAEAPIPILEKQPCCEPWSHRPSPNSASSADRKTRSRELGKRISLSVHSSREARGQASCSWLAL